MHPKQNHINNIQIEEYNYDLPEERIAKYPLSERDSSKLLVYKNGNIIIENFQNIHNYIPENNLLVVNDTRVIQARIIFHKNTGARIEIFCLEPFEPADFILNFQQKQSCTWKCIIGNKKKWKDGSLEKEIIFNDKKYLLFADKIKDYQSYQLIQFKWECVEFCFSDILEQVGETPIPPYLNRQSELQDKERYQTMYSFHEGSVAAPTAGLHFTENILEKLLQNGIYKEELTLHVGAGTFTPVKSDYIVDHEMHTEHFFVSRKSLQKIIENLGHIIAVGTTSLRTLESLYWLGVKVISKKTNDFHVSQWFPYETDENISPFESYQALLSYLIQNNLNTLKGSTQLMIVPGYKFKIAKGIITNFHQPKSTLLLLIAAFIGDDWKKVYECAMNNDFRFLSYGDSSLLLS